MGDNVCNSVFITGVRCLLVKQDCRSSVSDKTPILHSAVGLAGVTSVSLQFSSMPKSEEEKKGTHNYKFMDRQKINFSERIVDVEDL